MPFDTVERSTKRIRANGFAQDDQDDWYMQPSSFEVFSIDQPPQQQAQQPQQAQHHQHPHSSQEQQQDWSKSYSSQFDTSRYFPYQSSVLSSPTSMDYLLPATPSAIPIDIPYSAGTTNTEYLESSSLDDHISPHSSSYWQDDTYSAQSIQSPIHRPSIASTVNNNSSSSSPPKALVDSIHAVNNLDASPHLTDVLSKIQFSYSDVGINLEAKISNASELRSLIDAFSHMCCSTDSNTSTTAHANVSSASCAANTNRDISTTDVSQEPKSRVVDKMLLYRNKSNQTKPVNFFASTCRLGQISNPHSDSMTSLQQIADACVDTYFTCWVRFKPILRKDEFMMWYQQQDAPTDTLIVNAICSYVFRHMVIHHPRPGLNHFLKDQDRLQEQEEFFFSRARECLSQSFDTPDRYTVAALLFMSLRAEPSKRHHYAGLAGSALHELEIYPRMLSEDVDSYDKEMDTRLWWYAWAADFSLYTAGSPKNTPQPKFPGQVDLPQVFEQDIDQDEIGVITFAHCLTLWRIQADIVAALYDQQNSELTVEKLAEYDKRLLDFHSALPEYLVFDSGFEYGSEDLFLACLRVNIEYNATRIILHKLFIPEMNDTRPSQASLESLNICLSTALSQLSAIKTCNMGDVGRCAFDRDELWRAAEVISVTMDIYDTCISADDQAKILTGIKMEDFVVGLRKSYDVLQNTREFRFSCKNWFQVADWIQVEIRRHQLVGNATHTAKHFDDETHKKNKPDYFLAHLKPNAILNDHQPHPHEASLIKTSPSSSSSLLSSISTASSPPPPPPQKTSKQQPRKSISFQNQFSVLQPPSTPSSRQPSVPPQQSAGINSRKSSFSTAPPFVQFNAYIPPDQQQQQANGKNSARFRYFNPRKMNKFLFIDEHPMM
ncbi:hypothetical protein MAM1_0002c00193 [Mucor ambiguus]|uniref:Transcription factor domain-containing protein n=1 Tax=Mucor ambiguus TaxID=91626 RepID=A0A0C9LPG5_9FUNG|nr:hypothetical protein MAM1_0002c00193 [Mucor ambiguus]